MFRGIGPTLAGARHTQARFAKVLVIGLPCLLTCSCTSAPDDPWRSTVDDVRGRVGSDFEREVLSDGWVSDAEFAEAFRRFADCMHSAGYEVARQEYKGAYSGFFVPGATDVPSDLVNSCYEGTLQYIEPLYNDMRINPQNVNPTERLVECFRQRGLVAPEYSSGDYFADLERDPPSLPFDPDSEAAVDCLFNV